MELRSSLRLPNDALPSPPAGGAAAIMAPMVDIPPSPPVRGGIAMDPDANVGADISLDAVVPPPPIVGVVILLPLFPLGLGCSSFPPSSYGCCLSGDLLPLLGLFTMPPRIPSMGVLWPRHPRSSPIKAIRSFTTHALTSPPIAWRACRRRRSYLLIACPIISFPRVWRFWPVFGPRCRPIPRCRVRLLWLHTSLPRPRACLWLVCR